MPRIFHTDLFEVYAAQVGVLATLAAEGVLVSDLFLGAQELLGVVNLGAESQGCLFNRFEIMSTR